MAMSQWERKVTVPEWQPERAAEGQAMKQKLFIVRDNPSKSKIIRDSPCKSGKIRVKGNLESKIGRRMVGI